MLKLSNLTFGYAAGGYSSGHSDTKLKTAATIPATSHSKSIDTGFSQSISITVAPCSICVLRGPSGSGKSTLLSTLAGFQTPISGTATWNDVDLLSLTPWERPLTLLFQEGNLFEALTLFQNIALGVRPSGRLSKAETDDIHEVLDAFDIAALANRLPAQLSGGQQQRGALARAVIRKKPLLLLDEPFTGLDEDRRDAAITLIKHICRDQNLAIILVSHDTRDARALGASEHILQTAS